MSGYLAAISLFLLSCLIKKLFDKFSTTRQRAPYPPGPKPKPLIGNALDFPTSKAHEVYIEWGKRYQSDLVFCSAFGQNVLVLNKLEDADELLERRARKYTDRPVIPVIELMGWEWNFPLYPYGQPWRLHRQICQQNFRAEAARAYYPLLVQKTREMCGRLLQDPGQFEEHNKMLSISIPMITMYGYDVKSFEDPCIMAADEGTALGASLLFPGATLINVFPVLAKLPIPSWLPGASTWKACKRLRELSEIVGSIPYEFAKKGFEEGTAIESFMLKFFQKKDEKRTSDEEERATRNIAMTIYSAASDTTISSAMSFFYLMAIHPEIQRKAQAELDRVIGPTRLPDFNDRPSLPYIDAIYREVLRFAPPLPLALPHAVTEDDYYKGYFIPKGTVVFGNVWAMTRDEDTYPEPFLFKPERFLNEDGTLNDDKRILAYGFGRRICVGKHLASATMWIIIASVLACFNIEKQKDELGNVIEIDDEYDDFGATRHKSKFQCSFVPRMPKTKKLVEDVL